MLTIPNEPAERVTTAHRAKLAYVYIRQSTAGQVRQHQESTELQYRLVERAAELGWPGERITVIDDDLGKSGTSSLERQGFQRLMAEIGLGKAGLVLSLDASRLARNNRDWHQLLELCSIFGVVLADGERLYDPGRYHDRLLLGPSGIMSEAELHQIRMRLHQGERQKAMRGELRLPLPAGLAHDRCGAIHPNPDEEVQARLRLVFARFRELQNARAVMRDLQRHGMMLPVRPVRGPAPHEVVWMPPDSFRVLQILRHPSYAGSYVWGRSRRDPTRRRFEAADVSDLDHEVHGDHEVHAAQSHQALGDRRKRPARQELHDGSLDALEAFLSQPNRLHVFLQHDLVGRMLELLLLEPAPIPRAPVLLHGGGAAVPQHEGVHLLLVDADRLDCRGARAHQVAHRLVHGIGAPRPPSTPPPAAIAPAPSHRAGSSSPGRRASAE